jgi:hypothetical protein
MMRIGTSAGGAGWLGIRSGGRNEGTRMSTLNRFGEQRRSHRVHIAITVVLRGKRGEQTFEEETVTTVVNSAGGLALTTLALQTGQPLTVVHKKTAEEQVCKVAYVGVGEGNKLQVGFEFLEPSPKFWRIAFPPDNWDASERKRPGETPRVAQKPLPVTQVPGRK